MRWLTSLHINPTLPLQPHRSHHQSADLTTPQFKQQPQYFTLKETNTRNSKQHAIHHRPHQLPQQLPQVRCQHRRRQQVVRILRELLPCLNFGLTDVTCARLQRQRCGSAMEANGVGKINRGVTQ